MGKNKTGGGVGTNQYAVRGTAKTTSPSNTPTGAMAALRADADALYNKPPKRITATIDDAIQLAAAGDDDAFNAAFYPGHDAHPFWEARDDHGPLSEDGSPVMVFRAAQARAAQGHSVRMIVVDDWGSQRFTPFESQPGGTGLELVAEPSTETDPCNRCGRTSAAPYSVDGCNQCLTEDNNDYDEEEHDVNTLELAAERRALADAGILQSTPAGRSQAEIDATRISRMDPPPSGMQVRLDGFRMRDYSELDMTINGKMGRVTYIEDWGFEITDLEDDGNGGRRVPQDTQIINGQERSAPRASQLAGAWLSANCDVDDDTHDAFSDWLYEAHSAFDVQTVATGTRNGDANVAEFNQRCGVSQWEPGASMGDDGDGEFEDDPDTRPYAGTGWEEEDEG